ncbi:MAG: ribosome biogenesis GTPase YlqF [Mycoplasma sp.]
MSEHVNKINWFPGHMKKATDEIIKQLQNVDLIIEVLDARAPIQSTNQELNRIANQKPILKIALKKDISDIKVSEFPDILFGSIKDPSFKKIIINAINDKLSAKIERQKRKGLLISQFLVMVIGIPNVGKSSLINFLAPKKVLKVENRAGVTKNQATRKINDNFFLIDTPGVLVKKIENIEDGYKLAIINCISKNILPMHDVIKYCHSYFYENYKSQMDTFFSFKTCDNFDDFLIQVCDKYQYKIMNNEWDFDRSYLKLFNIFSDAEICKYHFKEKLI